NRATLAVSDPCDDAGGTASLRFVNARSMRTLGDVRLSSGYDCASTLLWLRPDRLLAVLLDTNGGRSQVVVVDPTARRVLRHVSLPDAPVFATGSTNDELVLVLGSSDSFVPAHVVAVDADGALRSTVVDDVLVGDVADQSTQDVHARTILPGL